MAKAEKMNRGISSKEQRGGGTEIKLPPGIHSLDAYGNVFASLPELSRVVPKYYTLADIKAAFEAGKLTTLSGDHVKELEDMVARK
ncbi:MAG: hypothetical protein PHU25_00740 [Deltaproteobacteria bacterium]|nr:hypothetical protein [Deltaproteobacteria bacterium]